MDADTLVFPSTAVDPNQPISPEIAQNGNIYNVWTLNLKTNELKQYHRRARRQRVAGRAARREQGAEDRLHHLLQG